MYFEYDLPLELKLDAADADEAAAELAKKIAKEEKEAAKEEEAAVEEAEAAPEAETVRRNSYCLRLVMPYRAAG